MEDRIVKEFPQIVNARASATQKEYGIAADIYSDILEDARRFYDQKSELMCFIYIEYAHSLISVCFSRSYDKLSRLSRREKVDIFDFDEDLEISWDLLEICRLTFGKSRDDKMLKKTHFLLGEVLLNNNKAEEALLEYEKAGESDEVLFRKALCYEFMGEYEKSIRLLEDIRSDNKELMEEIELEIITLRGKKEQGLCPKNVKSTDKCELEDININVRKK